MRFSSLIFCLSIFILLSCKDKKQPFTTGEYSNNLHLNTREDGTFYAWFATDSVVSVSPIAMLCVPHFPKANVALWLPQPDKRVFFGVLTHLGTDNFRIKTDSLIDASAQARQLQNGMTFKLKMPRPEWQHFYYFLPADTIYIYSEPRLTAPKRQVASSMRLYSDSLQGEWARVQTDSGAFWVPRNTVY